MAPSDCCGPWARALTPAETKPLAGRRIVVTRAPEQSGELLGLLRDAGAETSSLPMVRFFDPIDTQALDHAIAALDDFDWLVLTSANAVQFFLARCRRLVRWPGQSKPRIAAVGPATARALESEGLHVAFIPAAFNGAALAAELAPQLPGRRVLLPRSDRAEAELPTALRAAGADVTDVVAYRTVPPESHDGSLLGKICRGEVDAIIFSSPSAVREFACIVGAEALRRIGDRGAIAAVGSVTANAIHESGAQAAVEAPKATAASLVAALERYFAPQGAAKGRS
jgi:uroporphyrinogen III methyltransferase / synthase